MNLGEEVEQKMAKDPRWRKLPYEYALMCIALTLTYPQAYEGFLHRKSPEEIMFEVEEFTPEQIDEWYKL